MRAHPCAGCNFPSSLELRTAKVWRRAKSFAWKVRFLPLALEIFEHDGELVVDSRLIAERLGIEYRSFLETVENYRTQVEQAFGVLRFETAKPTGPQGRRRAKSVAWKVRFLPLALEIIEAEAGCDLSLRGFESAIAGVLIAPLSVQSTRDHIAHPSMEWVVVTVPHCVR